MEGVNINNSEAEIYFTRHAESEGNCGANRVDSQLSHNGILQAGQLSGEFDCVIISPLRRTKETLHYSSIKYNKIYISDNFRERIFSDTSRLLFEHDITEETDKSFFHRVNLFHKELEEICKAHKKILLIGHAYYFNAWYRRGCFPTPQNANIIRLK